MNLVSGFINATNILIRAPKILNLFLISDNYFLLIIIYCFLRQLNHINSIYGSLIYKINKIGF